MGGQSDVEGTASASEAQSSLAGEAAAELALAKKIQNARKAAGLTQQQLCDKAGLAYSTLAKIERGAIKSPSIFTISNIANSIGVSLDELIGASSVTSDKKRSSSGISFVYFDVNGCLVHFFQKAFTKLAHDTGQPLDKVESAFWHYNDDACRGDLSVEEFNQAFAIKLGLTNLDWISYYFGVVEPVEGMNELLAWVAGNYKIGLLTNVMPGVLDALRHRKLVPDVAYDAVIDSSVVGAIKPEAKIYELAEAQAGVPPNEILFIDDSRVNLTAAERLGWRVMWFDDYHAEESVSRVRAALKT